MAWTVKVDEPIIELIPDGSTDFIWDDHFPEYPDGIHIDSIQVYFSAANDKIEIRHKKDTAGGVRILKYTTLTGESVAKNFWGAKLKPYVRHAEQVYTTAASWVITIQMMVAR